MKKEIFKTIKQIEETKEYFEKKLAKELLLTKVECPLFVKTSSGLQDGLDGMQKAVSFKKDKESFEIVHSLAKWKREALYRYDFPVYEGLYTDMKAIRKDESVDEIHSLYVEQWDWEKIILKEDRTIKYLKHIVSKIYRAFKDTDRYLKEKYEELGLDLPKKVYFITSQELEDMYPDKCPKERERLITKLKRSVFIIGIGDKLKSGVEHDLRSPDYDDWTLDGDLLIYDDVLDREVEISSMGIRVDKDSLIRQLTFTDCLDKLEYDYHDKIVKEILPYTIGGGIGTSRVLLLLLKKKHICEVQASSWTKDTLSTFIDKDVL